MKSRWLVLLLVVTILHCYVKVNFAQNKVEEVFGSNINKQDDQRCTTEQLNQSKLVKCAASKCEDSSQDQTDYKPSDTKNIVHVYSTRMGDRLKKKNLPNYNTVEDEDEKLLNINTTLYIDTNQVVTSNNQVFGFGGTLDFERLLVCMEDNTLERTYGPIIRELFGEQKSGSRMFTILRLSLSKDMQKNQNASKLLLELDSLFARTIPNSKTELVLDLQPLEWTTELINTLQTLANSVDSMSALELTMISTDESNFLEQKYGIKDLFEYESGQFPKTMIVGSTSIRNAPNLLDRLVSTEKTKMKRIFIKSEFSAPYTLLDYIRRQGNFTILTLSSDKVETSNYGDWQTAQNYAVEILNHFKHGSNGFIESSSSNDNLDGKMHKFRDASIFNLNRISDSYYKGPMFYAIKHFSGFLTKGSSFLRTSVFTQPNMFAAQYGAFKTPSDHVVAIVLNNNEHLLPFRLSLDNKIVSVVNILPKSFNTFIIKAK